MLKIGSHMALIGPLRTAEFLRRSCGVAAANFVFEAISRKAGKVAKNAAE